MERSVLLETPCASRVGHFQGQFVGMSFRTVAPRESSNLLEKRHREDIHPRCRCLASLPREGSRREFRPYLLPRIGIPPCCSALRKDRPGLRGFWWRVVLPATSSTDHP